MSSSSSYLACEACTNRRHLTSSEACAPVKLADAPRNRPEQPEKGHEERQSDQRSQARQHTLGAARSRSLAWSTASPKSSEAATSGQHTSCFISSKRNNRNRRSLRMKQLQHALPKLASSNGLCALQFATSHWLARFWTFQQTPTSAKFAA